MRGTANREPITARTALELALAAGAQFRRGSHRHRVVIGKDTRLSGYMLEPALTAGFVSMGMDVVLLGPLPTPAVAMLTRSLRADLGRHDLGLPQSLPGQRHQAVRTRRLQALGRHRERHRGQDAGEGARPLAKPEALGRAAPRSRMPAAAISSSSRTASPRACTLDGLKIVVDCAHGAAYRVAPTRAVRSWAPR